MAQLRVKNPSANEPCVEMTRAGQNPTANETSVKRTRVGKTQQQTRQEIAETNRTEYISEQGQIGTAENPESNSKRAMRKMTQAGQNPSAK